MQKVPIVAMLALAGSTALLGCGAPAKGSHSEEGGAPSTPQAQSATYGADAAKARALHSIKTVFVIVMENHDWSSIHGNPSAPYINGTLLTLGAHAEHYTSPANTHPSEPNYIWMEAGNDLAIADDDDPSANYRTTKNHLTRLMDTANVPWRAYQEGATQGQCPIASSGLYAAKHDPFVFFDDVTDGRDPTSAHCIEHVRPYDDLARDLASPALGNYNFITPNLCDDMHDSAGCATPDSVANGDAWLAREVPKILASKAYREGGALFITWDESEGADGAPIGLIALSPFAKPGYAGTIPYTHSSLLRTVQEVLAVGPYLRDAANAAPLSDLFTSFP